MWNYDYHFLTTDDVDLRNFDADTGAIADHGPLTVERHFLLDHFRRLFWNGRLYVDPKPEKPHPNGYRAQQGLHPILDPFHLNGAATRGNLSTRTPMWCAGATRGRGSIRTRTPAIARASSGRSGSTTWRSRRRPSRAAT